MEEPSPLDAETLAQQCEHTEPTDSPAKAEFSGTVQNTDASLSHGLISQPNDEAGEMGCEDASQEEKKDVSLAGEDVEIGVLSEYEAPVTEEVEPKMKEDQLAEQGGISEALIDSTGAHEVLKQEEAQFDHAIKEGEENQDDKEENNAREDEGEEGALVVQTESDSFVETGPITAETDLISDEMLKEEAEEEKGKEDEERARDQMVRVAPKEKEEEEQEETLKDEETTQIEEEATQMDETENPNDDVASMHDEEDANNDDKEAMQGDDNDDETMHDDDEHEGAINGDAEEEEAMNDREEEEEEEEDDEPPPLPENKKKRGRPAKARKDEEDLCFICFDGGELVVCDRRGCPKVYHPSCVNRDESFFRSKGKWNCGWHICSNCQKPSRYMCYTCTYSLCKGCIKGSEFLCVRGNLGFCPTCLPTVTQIEKFEQGDTSAMEGVNFEDKNSWEYLFRDYWIDLKAKLSLTLEEILSSKTKKRIPVTTQEKDNSDERASSDSSSAQQSKKKPSKRLKRSASNSKPASSPRKTKVTKRTSKDKSTPVTPFVRKSRPRGGSGVNWASKELLDFVSHMRKGDRSQISQFDVQALLLDYIKKENLRDPRRKSQIVCDRMLVSLFGKDRVGHFEMLKLLESHFVEASATAETDETQGGVVDPDPDPSDPGENEGSNMEKQQRRRGKGKGKGVQGNLDDFASIDVHNIGLMYLKRNLMEEILDGDFAVFEEKVLGSFVRIRIAGTVQQRQDIYRLVQVVGTGKAAEKYKMGKKMTDLTLEILNLDKQEFITIDIISNQDFSEEECKRLRQSIKCGFIPRLTVGEVQEKARMLQVVKVNDWIESEKLRLGHLRDRASETGRRKELRECVEKLQTLSTPEEKMRRLREVPEIHADPTMDPDYESAEEPEPELGKKDVYKRRDPFEKRDSFNRRGNEVISPRVGGGGGSFSGDNWRGGFSSDNWRGSRKEPISPSLPSPTTPSSNKQTTPHPWSSEKEKERERERGREKETPPSKVASTDGTEKIWHYSDPSGKMQGPFSMVQLRKWNGSGYFPSGLKIWRTNEKQEDSVSLTDALSGKFRKEVTRDRELSFSSGTPVQYSGGKSVGTVETGRSGGAVEIKTDLVSSNSVATNEATHTLDRNSSFSTDGVNQSHVDATQMNTAQQQAAPSVTPSDLATSSSALATQTATQAMTTNAAWAAAMAQQMTPMGSTAPMGWNPVSTQPNSTANPWVNMVAPAGMNMNMGWAPQTPTVGNFNMGMGTMPNPWAAQAAQMQAWGAMMPGAVNPANQFPAYWATQAQSGNPIPVMSSAATVQAPPPPGSTVNVSANTNAESGQRGGICRFYESGHCKKGSGCNYYHPPPDENNKWQ